MNEIDLPANMRTKIRIELCPIAGLDGFCWTWTGATTSRGYGSVSHQGSVKSSHRLAYTLLVGPVGVELEIDHLCRNRRCCNPAHLEPVTRKVNAERAITTGKSHCINGHRLTDDNVVIKKRGARTPVRNCLTCRRDAQRARRGRARVSMSDLIEKPRANA